MSCNHGEQQAMLTDLHTHLDFLLVCQDRKNFKYKLYMERLLDGIFKINVKDVHLSVKEKTAIANKIKHVIPAINNYIFCLGNSFDPNLGKYNLIFCSAIQFLFDKLKMWPTEDGNLEKHLTIFLTSNSLETFNDAILEWQEDPPNLAIDIIFYPEEDYQRPVGVPMSHTWWCNK